MGVIQGTLGVIQGTLVIFQGTQGVIQGTLRVIYSANIERHFWSFLFVKHMRNIPKETWQPPSKIVCRDPDPNVDVVQSRLKTKSA
jgi:hypothetical protein